MKDDLRLLKESLDDTYFKDMELSKSLKKKIVKKATADSQFSRIRPKFAYFTSLVLAATCLLILAVSFMKTDIHQASLPTIREQQVALIHLQNVMIQLTKDQRLSEDLLIQSVESNQPAEKSDELRSKVIQDGEAIITGIKKMSIPAALQSNQSRLDECLQLLAAAYEQKNEYYKNLDLQNPVDLTPYHVPADTFIIFEEKIGEVYVNVHLLSPSFQLLLTFLR
ncbi:hypothetical protein [Neobacillus niacini]|uniref:hypothetical protein n=1 Tax=Neobacillus niacini TaxID=86668 RepID=UPI0021CB4E53|nr:hypothetical protein [Neobacillus niacini]MCM3764792.1 hypothetical protein [Neobacillus niacini]